MRKRSVYMRVAPEFRSTFRLKALQTGHNSVVDFSRTLAKKWSSNETTIEKSGFNWKF